MPKSKIEIPEYLENYFKKRTGKTLSKIMEPRLLLLRKTIDVVVVFCPGMMERDFEMKVTLKKGVTVDIVGPDAGGFFTTTHINQIFFKVKGLKIGSDLPESKTKNLFRCDI